MESLSSRSRTEQKKSAKPSTSRGRGRPSAPSHVEIDSTKFISRMEAARSMGRSRANMRKHEEDWLATKIKYNGVVYYPRQQFEEFQREMTGGDAGRCMLLFAKGLTPAEVMDKVKPRKPWIVRQCYEEHLALLELDPNAVLIRLRLGSQGRAWKGAHGFHPDEPLHPDYVRRAIEIVSLTPELHARCLLAMRQAEEQKRAKRKRAARAERAEEQAEAEAC